MRFRCIMFIVALLVLIAGCNKEAADSNVVDTLPGEDAGNDVSVQDSNGAANTATEPSTSTVTSQGASEDGLTKEEIAQILGQTGSDSESESDEKDSEETDTIVLDNFKGDPENIKIKVGDTVTWDCQTKNFKHVLLIREDLGNGYYSKEIIDPVTLVNGSTYEYTFEKAGTYQWYSKTKYPDVAGDITVE